MCVTDEQYLKYCTSTSIKKEKNTPDGLKTLSKCPETKHPMSVSTANFYIFAFFLFIVIPNTSDIIVLITTGIELEIFYSK